MMDPAADASASAIAFGFASGRHRAALSAAWAFDRAVGMAALGAREPMMVQLRLAWWRSAVTEGGHAWARDPELALLTTLPARELALLERVVDAWETLLLRDDGAALLDHADARGNALFGLAAGRLGGGDASSGLAGGWALASLAARSGGQRRERARNLAASRLSASERGLAKPLRVLIRIARADIRRPEGVARSRRTVLRAVLG